MPPAIPRRVLVATALAAMSERDLRQWRDGACPNSESGVPGGARLTDGRLTAHRMARRSVQLHRARVRRWWRRRRWRRPVRLSDGSGTRLDIAVSAVVDTARDVPLTGRSRRFQRPVIPPVGSRSGAFIGSQGQPPSPPRGVSDRSPAPWPVVCGFPGSPMCIRFTKTSGRGIPRTPATTFRAPKGRRPACLVPGTPLEPYVVVAALGGANQGG